MTNPNFFIVGAPKSGTTAMASYLGDHEQIFFCSPKEPCFFAVDFPGQRQVQTLDEYLSLFGEAGRRHVAVGEGTVWYLYSSNALENIRRFNSAARIVVMLRNPVEQVYSMHQELYHRRYETEEDFVEAWRLQERRRQGFDIPKYCKEAKFLQYSDIASYAFQVKRLLGLFPREQIKIVIFDDFKKDPARCYRETLEFLGLPDDGRVDFRPALESRRHKIHWLGTFLINQPSWLVKSKAALKKALGISSIGLRELVARHNTVVEKRKPLPPEFISELKQHFQPEVEELSKLLGRDLSEWVQ